MTNAPAAIDFAHIETWIFDLDNTLYPHETDLFSQVDVRMTAYICKLLNLDHNAAHKVQKDFYRDYGTTLKGLIEQYGVDPDDFLEKVHDIDYSWLKPDPALRQAISALCGRKLIFTNGDRKHAENTANELGILDVFDDIFDIKAADYIPKPERETYERFLARFNVEPQKAAMFEDLARNLTVPKALGMRTVLIVPNNFEPTYAEFWERDRGFSDDVDFVTDNLRVFLTSLGPQE